MSQSKWSTHGHSSHKENPSVLKAIKYLINYRGLFNLRNCQLDTFNESFNEIFFQTNRSELSPSSESSSFQMFIFLKNIFIRNVCDMCMITGICGERRGEEFLLKYLTLKDSSCSFQPPPSHLNLTISMAPFLMKN